MADNDAWELEELTPVNNAEITVADSYFEEGRFGTQLTLLCNIDIPIDPVDISFSTFSVWYGVGKGWQILENGGRIVKPDADPTKLAKIHASSRLGKLIARVIKDLKFDMQPRGLPTEAKVWKGLKMHMLRELVHYEGIIDETSGEAKTIDSSILLPVSVSVGGESTTPPMATPTPSVAVPQSSLQPSEPASANGLSDTDKHILSLAVGKASLAEAKAAIVRDPVIANDNAASSRVLEHGLLEQWLASGILQSVDGRLVSAAQ